MKYMKNVRIEKMNNGCITSYLVIADTIRFGKDTIMYQGTLEGCKKYIKDRRVKLKECLNYNSFSHGYVRNWKVQ